MRPNLVGRLNVVPIMEILIPFQAVLFFVLFQGILFSEKEPFKRQKMVEKALMAEPILDLRQKIEEIQRLRFERGEKKTFENN